MKSALPLFNLRPWLGRETEPGLNIAIGAVPELKDAVHLGPLVQLGPDGACRFAMPEVASYLVNAAGTEITVDPFLPVDEPDISAFLYSTVFAIICFKRGWLPLHAASVRVGDTAVAFCGVSGAGKSTLASRFVAKGVPILSDDVSVLDVSDPAHVRLRPSLPHIKLWSDVMEESDISSDGLIPVRGRINKFYMPLEEEISDMLPLSAVYHLETAHNAEEERITPLSGVDSFLRLNHGIFRRRIGQGLISEQGLFQKLAPVVGSARSYCLRRILSLARADEIVGEILLRERE